MTMSDRQLAIKIAGKVDPSMQKSCKKAQGLISSIVKADLIASGIKTATRAMTNFVKGSIDTYASYEQSMANAGAIANASAEDMLAMQKAAEEAGAKTSFTASQAADALGYMALAGWDVKTSTQALQPVLKLAQATGADLATTSDLVTDSMSAMGIKIDDLQNYLDVLVTTNNKANTTAGQLMDAMKSAGSATTAAGMNYKQTATALGILANNGIKGAEAGTAMNSMLMRMTGKKEALKAYKQLGVAVFDAKGNIRDFADILRDTDAKLSKLSDAKRASMIAQIAGTNYAGQYQFLLKGVRQAEDGSSEWDKLAENINKAGGSLDTMNDKATNTLSGAFTRLNSAIDGARIAFFKTFGDDFKQVVDYVASAVIPKISNAIGGITKVAVRVINFIKDIKDAFFSAGQSSTVFGNTTKGALNFIGKYGQTAYNVIKSVIDVMSWLGDKIGSVIGYLLNIKQVISDVNNFYSEHEDLINVIGIALAGLTTALLAYNAQAIATAIASKALAIGLNIYSVAMGIATGATSVFGAVMAFVTSPIFLVVAAITAVVAVCYLLYKNWDKVTAFMKTAWQSVGNFLNQIWQAVWNKIGGVVTWYINYIKGIFNAIKAGWNFVCNAIKTIWQGYINYLSNTWQAIKNGFLAVCNFIKNVFVTAVNNIKIIFNGIIDFIVNVFSGNFKGAWDSITGIFAGVWENFKNIAKAPLNWIIDKINAVINGINSVKVPDWVPGVGGMGANIANIPALATGGIVSSPTLAMIGEGNESEAVMPLSKLKALLAGENSIPTVTLGRNGTNNNVTFAPVINVTGGNATQSEVKQAMNEAFKEFKRMFNDLQKDQRRRNFINA